MEKAKNALIVSIVVLAFLIIFIWKSNQDGNLFHRPNWQWEDNWGNQYIPTHPQEHNRPQQNIPHRIVANSFEDALQKSKESGRPIVVIFGASWCQWCRKLESETLTESRVMNRLENYVYLKVDADTERKLAEKFSISGLPAMVILDSDGHVLKRDQGFKDAKEFSNWLS